MNRNLSEKFRRAKREAIAYSINRQPIHHSFKRELSEIAAASNVIAKVVSIPIKTRKSMNRKYVVPGLKLTNTGIMADYSAFSTEVRLLKGRAK